VELRNKVVVVTGGAHGVGLACAARFTTEGARVAIIDLDEDAVREAGARIGALPLSA